MSETELLFGFYIGLIVVAVGSIVLAGLQLQRIHKEAAVAVRMRRLRRAVQPSVTVLVYARGAQDFIIPALRHLKNNRYHAFDVVVIDDASVDETSQRVHEWMRLHPEARVRILRRRKQTSIDQALLAGYRKSQHGSIVIALSAQELIDASCIKRAVASQGQDSYWRVTLKRHLAPQLRLLDIGLSLENYFWQKERQVRVYESKYFTKHAPKKVSEYSSLVAIRGAVGALLLLLLLIAAFLAVGVQVLWYAWVVVTAYGLVAVWLRYGETLRDRLVLTLSVPLALFLIPTASTMRGISQGGFKK